MSRRRNLLKLLFNNKRIDLTAPGFSLRTKITLLSGLLFIYAVLLLTYKIDHLSYSSAVFILAISGGSTLFAVYLYTHLQATSIKGETLLLKSLNNVNKVTSVHSVKNVRTIVLPGVYFTSITYFLDGIERKALLFTRSRMLPSTPEKALKKAIKKYSKEKGKS